MRNDVMDVKDAYNFLAEATSVANLESFMVFGGEPMLYPNRTTAIFRKANELKIPEIEMLTNGVWGKSKEKAEKLATALKKAGLNTVGISVDAFHLQWIPLEYPRNSALALLKAGVKNVTWNVAVIESINAGNEYDVKTKQILEELEPVGIDTHYVKIMPVGRAVQNLRQYFHPTSLEGSCESEPVIGNVLTNPESICIEPSGEVDICWHLAIGNAKETPLNRTISNYDWRKIPAIKTLVEEGPTGLLKYSRPYNNQFRKCHFINKCHLCIEIRKTLTFHEVNLKGA
jgi:molybdenum cofactor biosynthesis enzyme MoaA